MFVIDQTKPDQRPKNLDGGVFLLVVTGLRYYTPRLGRWISRDPIGEMGGVNILGMTSNNAIGLVDVLGLSDCCPDELFYENCRAPFMSRLTEIYRQTAAAQAHATFIGLGTAAISGVGTGGAAVLVGYVFTGTVTGGVGLIAGVLVFGTLLADTLIEVHNEIERLLAERIAAQAAYLECLRHLCQSRNCPITDAQAFLSVYPEEGAVTLGDIEAVTYPNTQIGPP